MTAITGAPSNDVYRPRAVDGTTAVARRFCRPMSVEQEARGFGEQHVRAWRETLLDGGGRGLPPAAPPGGR